MQFMVEHKNWDRAVLTTAWFIDQINHRFDLMCSRSPATALSLFDQENPVADTGREETFTPTKLLWNYHYQPNTVHLAILLGDLFFELASCQEPVSSPIRNFSQRASPFISSGPEHVWSSLPAVNCDVALHSVTSSQSVAMNSSPQRFIFGGHGEMHQAAMLTKTIHFVVQKHLDAAGNLDPAKMLCQLKCRVNIYK